MILVGTMTTSLPGVVYCHGDGVFPPGDGGGGVTYGGGVRCVGGVSYGDGVVKPVVTEI